MIASFGYSRHISRMVPSERLCFSWNFYVRNYEDLRETHFDVSNCFKQLKNMRQNERDDLRGMFF